MSSGGPLPGGGRNLVDWLRRWGVPGKNIRGVWDQVVPVAVIDRFRDDDMGSLFGISAATLGAANQYPAVAFGSGSRDWEILGWQTTGDRQGFGGGTVFMPVHVFTPIVPYNPVEFNHGGVFFEPGLITNRSFTKGTVQAIGGTNPALPATEGWRYTMSEHTSSFRSALFPPFNYPLMLPSTPIRMYRDFTIVWQVIHNPVIPLALYVSLIYRELPPQQARGGPIN